MKVKKYSVFTQSKFETIFVECFLDLIKLNNNKLLQYTSIDDDFTWTKNSNVENGERQIEVIID